MDIKTSELPRYGLNRDVCGLPPRAVVLTNSERMSAACARRWHFGYAERLKGETSMPLRIGSCWANFKESLTKFWAENPISAFPASRDYEAIEKYIEEWRREQEQKQFNLLDEEDLEQFELKLQRMVRGYFERNGRHPPQDLQILHAEFAVAAPILNPKGQPFCPMIPVMEIGGKWRPARYGDPEDRVKWVRWPWYQLGKLDCVAKSKVSQLLWVWEDKSSSRPQHYYDSLTIDPQVTGYEFLLAHAASLGVFGEELQRKAQQGQRVVAGYIYEVTSTLMQQEPKQLKNGKLSTAKANTPSWLYLDAIRELGLNKDDYADHIAYLRMKKDSSFYHREKGVVGAEEVARYRRELYGVARKHAQMRRDAYRTSPEEIEYTFPRTQVCKAPGSGCAFKGPCARDVPETRAGFNKGDEQLWLNYEPPTGGQLEIPLERPEVLF